MRQRQRAAVQCPLALPCCNLRAAWTGVDSPCRAWVPVGGVGSAPEASNARSQKVRSQPGASQAAGLLPRRGPPSSAESTPQRSRAPSSPSRRPGFREWQPSPLHCTFDTSSATQQNVNARSSYCFCASIATADAGCVVSHSTWDVVVMAR